MDKSDVDMEDVIKGPQDLENAAPHTQNDYDSVDGKLKDDEKKLPHSPAGAGGDSSMHTEGSTKENDIAESHGMTDQNNAKSDVEVLKSEKNEPENGNNVMDKEVAEAESPNNMRSEVVKEAGDQNNVTSGEVKQAGDQNNVTSGEVKQAEDPNILPCDDVKEAEDREHAKSEEIKKTGKPNSVKDEGLKEAEELNNGTSEVKGEAEDQNNITSGARDESDTGNEENAGQDGISSENIVDDQKHSKNGPLEKNLCKQESHPVELAANKAPQNETEVAEDVHQNKDEVIADDVHQTDNNAMVDEPKESEKTTASITALTVGDNEKAEMQGPAIEVNKTDQNVNQEKINVTKDCGNKSCPVNAGAEENTEMFTTPMTKNEVDSTSVTASIRCSTRNTGSHSGETYKNIFHESKMPGDEDGTPEEQTAFMRELESFYRERALEFKPPRFYGQQLNCLKLWRAVIRLGGYDRVTGSKLWRQVGESFHPPKTCTTVSWTFRIFYEKALLEYERYKKESGELQLPLVLPDPSGADSEGNGYQASGSGRARRDAAARAMQGWHAQRLLGSGEVGDPAMKDKNFSNMPKREKNIKNIGSLKQKRPNEVEHAVKAARTETSKQLVASVVDVGPPADWVKINVRETKDCFEVYALVPGLLREEVRVQSDPAGRLVITGQPEQPDNPWGIAAFKKVVSLPGRIDPLQTSAVVSLHGRLFVRVPFEQSTI